MIRWLWCCLPLLFLGPGGVLAAPAVDEAQVLVEDTSTRVLERLRADRDRLRASPDLIYPLVEDLVLPHFDFTRMAQWVLGKHWRAATEEQRTRFTGEFRTLLVRTYAKALLEYTDQRIRYLAPRASEDGRSTLVRTEVEQPGGYVIAINYSLHPRDGAWKVYDIVVDGVSLVTNYRSSFNEEVAKGGMEQLLQHLAELNGQK